MCIAIYKPEGTTISKATLERCFNANPDGAGFMYVEDKQLHMQKGFFKFTDFYKEYKQHANKQAVIHFRIKTHGPINKDNCHPFLVNNGIGFVHNGVISGFGEGDMSDTRHFNEEIIKPLVSKWGNLSLFQPAIKSLIEARIGYSKLIFLDRHGNHDIFNENKGIWENDVWYSNSSYQAPKPIVKQPSSHFTPAPFSGYNRHHEPKKFKPLEIGDLVELTRNHYDNSTKLTFFKGELFEVVAINQDFTADLMAEHADDSRDFIYNIPFSAVSVLRDELDDEDGGDGPYAFQGQSKFWGY